MDTLLMLSGGIDSAYCLWKRVEAGLPTRTHHVHLSDHEGRQHVEAKATKDILSWVKAKGGVVKHSESWVDFGSMWIPYNFHLWSYWAGVVMAAPDAKGITSLVLPRHSDSWPGKDPRTSPIAKQSDAAWKSHASLVCHREPTLLFPMVHLTKAEVVQQVPKDLLELCWWCRKPFKGEPCHKCRTCRQVDAAIS